MAMSLSKHMKDGGERVTQILCPNCGEEGKRNDTPIIPIFYCSKCEVEFGRCHSIPGFDKDTSIGCNEVVIFRLMDCYSVERQDLSDDLKKKIEETGDGRDTSLFLDENRAELLASQYGGVSVVEEMVDGKVSRCLRVPSWMSKEGGELDLGINNTMCAAATTDLVCEKCGAGHYYDIIWHN